MIRKLRLKFICINMLIVLILRGDSSGLFGHHEQDAGGAIAKQITESHKGKIWAESGGGVNRFCVLLPTE